MGGVPSSAPATHSRMAYHDTTNMTDGAHSLSGIDVFSWEHWEQTKKNPRKPLSTLNKVVPKTGLGTALFSWEHWEQISDIMH